MNKHCYRIIFNRARGMLMVVAEIAKSHLTHTSSGGSQTNSITARLAPITLGISLALGGVMLTAPAQAAVVADKTAPGNQQPVIVQSGNGTTQVNIQAPSAGGVSRNTYSQFDVDQKGVILNNSRHNVNTQLGGFVAGNGHLAGGEAKIILNEVNSRNPSQLNGFIEVAGQRAQVIIANPSGITCDGCGVINASRTTLTTGKALITNGNLDGFQVEQGKITVTGKGMDSSRQDYTDLIARSVEVNAGLWANELTVTTGRNRVSADGKTVQALSGRDEDKPLLAIDVAQLGGMYAGKIHLIGTEQGVGVRNAGHLGAQAGSVTISSDGRIENSGTLKSATDTQLTSASQIDNRGTIYAGHDLHLNAAAVNNQATLAAAKNLNIRAKTLNTQSGSLTAAGITAEGKLGTQGNLRITADQQVELRGALLAASQLWVETAQFEQVAGAETAATETSLKVSGRLTNRGLIDGSQTRISAGTLDNLASGRIYGSTLSIEANTLNNLAENGVAATLAARQQLNLGVGTLSNRGHSLIYSDGGLNIGRTLDEQGQVSGRAGQINNHSSTIEAAGDATVTVGVFNNINDNFVTDIREISREQMLEYQAAGAPGRWGLGDVTLWHGEVQHMTPPDSAITDEFYQYDYTRIISETVIVESDPARLLAGGKLLIDAIEVLNDKSQIAAGGLLRIIADRVDNVAVEGLRYTYDTGQVYHWYRINKTGDDRQGLDAAAYSPDTVIQGLTLTPSTLESETAFDGSGTVLDTLITHNSDSVSLPAGSLYLTNPAADGKYLIETDPRFVNYRDWLSSDYMLSVMRSDPNTLQKRLGDGYYEQKLIREQILSLTGQRYLDGHSNDEAQYKALMEAGVAFAGEYSLSLGVALTTQQMSQLTTDIVWMVSKTVTLADGSQQQVLVPQVYARAGSSQVNGSGALISGAQSDVQLSGELNNRGTLVGHQQLNVLATTINNMDGAQISGNRVNLNAREDINNSGAQIQAVDSLSLQAGRDINISSTTAGGINHADNNQFAHVNIKQTGSLDVTGENATLNLQAGRDVTLTAAVVVASGDNSQIAVEAGHDIALNTLTTLDHQALNFDSKNSAKQTSTQDVGSVISGAGHVSLTAGQDVSLKAAGVYAGEKLNVSAGNNLSVESGESTLTLEHRSQSIGQSGGLAAVRKKRTDQLDYQQAIGSQLAGNEVSLSAGQDISIKGSSLNGSESLTLSAGRDLTITAAQERYQETHHREETKVGLMSGGGLNFTVGVIQDKNTSTRDDLNYAGSTLNSSGGTITLSAGNALTVAGSSVAAQQDLTISGNTVDITTTAAQNELGEKHHNLKAGLMGTGGIGVTAGISSEKTTSKESSTLHQGSTIGSINGNVTITANEALKIHGSEVIAGNDIGLSGESVSITAANDVIKASEKTRTSSGGLTVALSGGAATAVSAIQMAEKAAREEDSTLSALKGVKAGMSAWQAGQDLRKDLVNIDPKDGAQFVGVSTSAGAQHSESETTGEQHRVKSSTVAAGGNLSITATGKPGSGHANSGDIIITGSQIAAEKDTTLSAERDLIMTAAANTQKMDSKETSGGANVGVSLGLGKSNGLTIFGDANFAKNSESGNGTEWVEATVSAGNTLTITTGRDATLTGAQAKGDKVVADIGGNLTIQSLQDSDQYTSENLSISGGGSGGFGGGAHASLGAGSMDSNYQSVIEQSGIFAGQGGVDITVGNHTQLNGAVIASEADADKNSLDTGTLGWSDIENKAKYKVEQINVSGGVGGMGLPGAVHKEEDAQSTTHAAVTEGTITIRNEDAQLQDVNSLSRDTDNANEILAVIFDKEKEQKRLETVQTISEISTQFRTVVQGEIDIAAMKQATVNKNDTKNIDEAKQALIKENSHKEGYIPSDDAISAKAFDIAYGKAREEIMKDYGTGSHFMKGVDAVTAGLQGVAGGNMAGAAAGASAPYLAGLIKDYTDKGKDATTEDKIKNALAHAILGAMTAAANGGNAAAGAAGASTGEIAAGIIMAQFFPGKDVADLSETDRRLISALSSTAAGLAGGLVGDSTGSIATGVGTGKNAVDNNFLGNNGNIIGMHADTAKKIDSIVMAPNLSDAEKQQALQELVVCKDCHDPATEYIEGWMKTSDYILMVNGGRVSEIISIIDMIKAGVSSNASPEDLAAFAQLQGKLSLGSASLPSDGKGTGVDASKVKENIAASQKGNESSNFGKYLTKEEQVFANKAQQDLVNEINNFSSKSQAGKNATMVGAYDPVTGKTAIGNSNANITAEALHPKTVAYIESQLGVKIGEFTSFCKNKAGACAEVSAADQLIRQGANPSKIKFTDAVRPKTVYEEGKITPESIIKPCTNCQVTWPKGK